jgi:FolB domain-containing protein
MARTRDDTATTGGSDVLDRILIRDLMLRCIVGINEDERREKQDVRINIVLYTDLRLAGRTDRFEDAVDYRAIKKRIVALVEGSSYFLVEALAEAVAAACLEDVRVPRVRVRVEKPGALRFARSVGVEITRQREP